MDKIRDTKIYKILRENFPEINDADLDEIVLALLKKAALEKKDPFILIKESVASL